MLRYVHSTEVYLSWREVLCVQNGYMVGYYAICGSERNMQQSKSVMTTGNTIDGLTPLHMLSKWQQSTSTELVHSLNPSHLEVNDKLIVYVRL